MKISIEATTHEGYIAPKEEFDILSGHAAGVCYMPENFAALKNEPIDYHCPYPNANLPKLQQNRNIHLTLYIQGLC